ncbi:40S ribosomal protein S7 [Dirofilaria immitis]|nr:40S ribosomal protein S7 [Dirofilaria immitis]
MFYSWVKNLARFTIHPAILFIFISLYAPNVAAMIAFVILGYAMEALTKASSKISDSLFSVYIMSEPGKQYKQSLMEIAGLGEGMFKYKKEGPHGHRIYLGPYVGACGAVIVLSEDARRFIKNCCTGRKVPDELEKQVSNAIADLESNSDIRAQLRELYIVGAKPRLVRELEKKFSGKHVVFIARRRILPKPKRGKNRRPQKQKRPRSRTLTAVHDAMLADLVYPAEVVGRRIRVKLDGKRIMKVHLDKTQQTNVEHKKPAKMHHSSNNNILHELTNEELRMINDLRTVIPTLETTDSGYIARWLRSRDGRFDETADALKKHMIFRKAWDLDNLSNWKAPEILEKYCGYGFLPDKDGFPILMSLLGNMDVEGMLKSVQSSDYIKYSLAAIEQGIRLCSDKSKETGHAFEQMMIVFDLDHISSAHYSCKAFASSLQHLLHFFKSIIHWYLKNSYHTST